MTTLDKLMIIALIFISLGISLGNIYSINKQIKHLEQVTFGSSRCPK